MRNKYPLVLSLPDEVNRWVRREAGLRRQSVSEFAFTLLSKGIQADSIDQAVCRLSHAVQADPILREMLVQLMVVRRLLEQVPLVAHAGTALAQELTILAERELQRRWPQESGHGDHRSTPPQGPDPGGGGRAP